MQIRGLPALSNVYLKNDRGQALANFAATIIERGDRVPKPIQDHICHVLRNPLGQEGRKRGPQPLALVERDTKISLAVFVIAKQYGFSPTRNRASERACAASIVKNALDNTARPNITEAEVARIFARSPFRQRV
jgi:hypothetical protein